MGSTVIIPTAQLLSLASSLRSDGAPAQFCFGTKEQPFCGGQCQVYAVNFPGHDTTTWAIRVYTPMAGNLPSSSVTSIVETEMEILRKLETSSFHWSPRLIGGDHSFENSIGHPYTVLTWVSGTPLEWSPSIPAEQQQRQKILQQLVAIQLDLVEATKESRAGTTSQQYLTDIINGKIGRVRAGSLPELDISSCLFQRALIPYVVHEGLGEPFFAVAHGNLASRKIIIDSECNITGIIDWKLARCRPLQLSLRLPRFLAMELTSAEEQQPHVSAIDCLQPGESLLVDRQFVLSELSSIASKDLAATQLASAMKTIWSDPSVDWQDLVIGACFSKGLHKLLATKSWFLDAIQTSAGQRVIHPSEEVIEAEVRQLSFADKP